MKTWKFVLSLLTVGILGYGALFLFSYVSANLVPFSIFLIVRVGFVAMVLPGMVSAAVVGLALAVTAGLMIPKRPLLASLMALTPTLAVLLWVVVTYGSGKTSWVELSDIISLLFFTHMFARLGSKWTTGRRN